MCYSYLFYIDDVYKRKQAQHFVAKKHQLDDYLKTIAFQSSQSLTPNSLNQQNTEQLWFV